jgi:hypothetical protein
MCLSSLVSAAEQEFPYTAYIARREVSVRSGPGRNFYATDNLPAGEEVEVYRHEDDWCAIRPPPDSFSWVRAEDLRIGRDGIGIVLVDGTPSRIGSSANEFRDVIQVRLQRGEQVEVLDAVQVSNDNGVEFHCKIAPPSGEFRWIHKDDISREQPRPWLREDLDEGAQEAADRAPHIEPIEEQRPAPSDRWGTWMPARRSDREVQSNAFVAGGQDSRRGSTSSRSISLASSDQVVPADRALDNGRSISDQRQSPPDEVEQIDRELSRIVVTEPDQWNLDGVRRRTDKAFEQASSAVVRRKLQDLQDRIKRFDDIHKRSLALATPAAGTVAGPAEGARGEPPVRIAETSPRINTENDPARYDGVGKLTPVVSERPGAPRYALVNQANEVVTFVSPAPGVNLRSFEGEYVGISGQRGYMPELKKPHVTALRINPLKDGPSRVARRQ